MIETAREMSREPYTGWTDRLQNQDGIAGYYSLDEAIIDASLKYLSTDVYRGDAAPKNSGSR